MTARTRYWWAKLKECGELLYGRTFPLRLKGAVHKSNVRPAIQPGTEQLCLKESDMGISQKGERSMVTAMCAVQLKDRKGSMDVMLMLGLK